MRLDWFIIRLISPYESSAPRHFRMRCVNFHFSNCYRYFLFRSRNSLAAFTCEYQIREVDRPVRLGYLVRVECSIGAHFNEKKNKINNVSPSKSKVAKREREKLVFSSTYTRATSGKLSFDSTTPVSLAAPLLPRVRAVCTRVRCSFFIHPRTTEWQKRAGGLSPPLA